VTCGIGDMRKREEIQQAVVDFFVRACVFEKQAGYLERSIALFQVPSPFLLNLKRV